MKYSTIFFLSIILISCQQKKEQINWNELTIEKIDSLNTVGGLNKKFYPNMSACGGALNGFYYKDELVFIDATFQGEISFTRKKMYLSNSEFIKIKYQEHFPEREKYEKNYPKDQFKFDPRKMTFSDTFYEFEFKDKIGFKKIFEGKIISTELDSTLLDELIDCGTRMKKELETITE